jgi:hypothetical protein
VLSLFLLCALTFWLAITASTYRTSNRLSALTILAGLGPARFRSPALARRISNATPSETSGHLFEIIARYAPLVVLKSDDAQCTRPGARLSCGINDENLAAQDGSHPPRLAVRAEFSSMLFALGIASVLAVTAMRLLDRAMLRWRPSNCVARSRDRAIVAAALFCAWAYSSPSMAASIKGRTSPSIEARS